MNKNELKHHGVMGMHWGIRRYQPYGEGGYNPKKKGKYTGEKKKDSNQAKGLSDRQKNALKVAASVGIAVVTTYGAYKVSKNINPAVISAGKKYMSSSKNKFLTARPEMFVNENPVNSSTKVLPKLSARDYAKSLSDADLSKAINRIKQENEYVALSSERVTQGKEFAKNLAIVGGTTLATTLVTKAGGKTGEAVVAAVSKKTLDPAVFRAIYSKKK